MSVQESKINNTINNPINNPIYGPIHRAKKKEQRVRRDLEYLREHPECGAPLSDEEKTVVVNNILSTRELAGFGSQSISELVENEKIVIYFGINITYYYIISCNNIIIVIT